MSISFGVYLLDKTGRRYNWWIKSEVLRRKLGGEVLVNKGLKAALQVILGSKSFEIAWNYQAQHLEQQTFEDIDRLSQIK